MTTEKIEKRTARLNAYFLLGYLQGIDYSKNMTHNFEETIEYKTIKQIIDYLESES